MADRDLIAAKLPRAEAVGRIVLPSTPIGVAGADGSTSSARHGRDQRKHMRVAALVVSLLLLAGCRREDRSQTTDPHAEGANGGAVLASPEQAHYAANAYHIGEGQRLYSWMNCSGCHGPAGGGGMGPSLMDAQ